VFLLTLFNQTDQEVIVKTVHLIFDAEIEKRIWHYFKRVSPVLKKAGVQAKAFSTLDSHDRI
jgi:hypothetical protein